MSLFEDGLESTHLPIGTVTFLFTDIEGSTLLWDREPEKMAVALQIHNAVLRQAIEAQGGVIFKTVGDEFQLLLRLVGFERWQSFSTPERDPLEIGKEETQSYWIVSKT